MPKKSVTDYVEKCFQNALSEDQQTWAELQYRFGKVEDYLCGDAGKARIQAQLGTVDRVFLANTLVPRYRSLVSSLNAGQINLKVKNKGITLKTEGDKDPVMVLIENEILTSIGDNTTPIGENEYQIDEIVSAKVESILDNSDWNTVKQTCFEDIATYGITYLSLDVVSRYKADTQMRDGIVGDFQKGLVVNKLPNVRQVIYDLKARKADYSDMDYLIVFEEYSKKDIKKLFGISDKDIKELNGFSRYELSNKSDSSSYFYGYGDAGQSSISGRSRDVIYTNEGNAKQDETPPDKIVLATFYYCKASKEMSFELLEDDVYNDKELKAGDTLVGDDAERYMGYKASKNESFKVSKKSEKFSRKVYKCIKTRDGILGDVIELPFRRIPVFPIPVNTVPVSGRRIFESPFYGAIDSQHDLNLKKNLQNRHLINNIEQEKIFIPEEGITNETSKSLEQGSNKNYVSYRSMDVRGKNLTPPVKVPVTSTLYQQIGNDMAQSRGLIDETIGQFGPQIGRVDPSVNSGRMAEILAARSLNSSSIILNTFASMFESLGRTIIQMLPDIYNYEDILVHTIKGGDENIKDIAVALNFKRFFDQIKNDEDTVDNLFQLQVKPVPRDSAKMELTALIESLAGVPNAPQFLIRLQSALLRNLDIPGGDVLAKKFEEDLQAMQNRPDPAQINASLEQNKMKVQAALELEKLGLQQQSQDTKTDDMAADKAIKMQKLAQENANNQPAPPQNA